MDLEEVALCQLGMMIFSDNERRLDFVYLVTETPDNNISGVKVAAEISRKNRVKMVGESETIIGVGGFTHPACDSPKGIKEKLAREEAAMNYIVEVNYLDAPVGPNGLHHTGTEMAMVARYAIEHNYGQVGLTAPPFHQLRSYLHLLTALHRAGRTGQAIKVFNYAGSSQSWVQEAVHSQGEIKASRVALLHREIENCLKYWQQGYLISPVEALGYFISHRS